MTEASPRIAGSLALDLKWIAGDSADPLYGGAPTQSGDDVLFSESIARTSTLFPATRVSIRPKRRGQRLGDRASIALINALCGSDPDRWLLFLPHPHSPSPSGPRSNGSASTISPQGMSPRAALIVFSVGQPLPLDISM